MKLTLGRLRRLVAEAWFSGSADDDDDAQAPVFEWGDRVVSTVDGSRAGTVQDDAYHGDRVHVRWDDGTREWLFSSQIRRRF